MSTKPLRLLVADDHEIVRRGLMSILHAQPGWEVVAEVGDGRSAVAEAVRTQPDVCILDVTMPEMNGVEATRRILEALPRMQVLILTLHESAELVRQILAAGARGYVLKSDSSRDLVVAVDALAHNRTFFSHKISDLVLASFLQPVPMQLATPETPARLSPREREIVQLLAEGKSNKEIAWILSISVKTVETHRSNVLTKLNLHSVADLVRYAIRHKIIES